MVKGILINRGSDEMLRNQLKMEHADLIAEMQTVENLPTHERLQLARLRRTQQLKSARQKEKEWMKLQRAKGNTAAQLNGATAAAVNTNNTTHHFRSSAGRRHISFENSVVLLEAASRNDMQEVAELLQHGITPDAANEDGLTALHQCCIDNNVEMLRLLLQYGANVDAQDSDKWTPLHAASTCGHLELVRILIEHGANLLAVNTDGNMPYDLCDDENTLDFIEAEMSKRGVTQELIDETRSSTERQMLRDLMEIARCSGDLEEPDYQGATPLHIAAANGYSRVVEFLLEMHVNVDALDKDLWSPVHAAACWGHLEVLEMLAQFGADLNVKNKDDETPSDICEDPEIRERIEQLKTEQESKRMAEAQRRRVRRSQSNNTRAQSVRRTSLRDKTLTTKKDAVEEARLRLQAQEVFTAPDSTTMEPTQKGIVTAASTLQALETKSSNDNTAKIKRNLNELNGDTLWCAIPSATKPNNAATIAYNKETTKSSFSTNLAAHNSNMHSTTHTAAAASIDLMDSYLPPRRRPPDGKENDGVLLQTKKLCETEQLRSTASASATPKVVVATNRRHASTGVAAEAVQVQSSQDAANGKINVQVTVLVDTASSHQQHLSGMSQLPPQPSLEPSSAFAGATLSHLKKQRSQSRSCVLNENGSLLGAVNNTGHSAATNIAANTIASNHNNNDNRESFTSITHQPMGADLNCDKLDFSSLNAIEVNTTSAVNKFSGMTGEVVGDSAKSRKCCALM